MADMLAAGIVVAAVAAVCFEAGYVLQALDARTAPATGRAAGTLAALVRRRRWLGGLALAGAGALAQVLALRLAPLTVVQPALALGVVALVLVGGRVLGEPAGPVDGAAALLIAVGVVALGLAGRDVTEAASRTPGAAVVLALLGGLLACALLVRGARPALLVAGAGAGDAFAALAAERLAHGWAAGTWLVALAWAVAAGAAGAGSLSVEMAALRDWPATRVGPIVLVCQTVVPVLVAPIVAGERWGSRAPAIVLGLAAVAAGAAWLARSAGRAEVVGAPT